MKTIVQVKNRIAIIKNDDKERNLLLQHIRDQTTAPITVYITSRVKLKKLPRSFGERVSVAASMHFHTQMPWTVQKNAVLVFIAIEEDEIRIIADTAAHIAIGKEGFAICTRILKHGFVHNYTIPQAMSSVINELGGILIREFPKVA